MTCNVSFVGARRRVLVFIAFLALACCATYAFGQFSLPGDPDMGGQDLPFGSPAGGDPFGSPPTTGGFELPGAGVQPGHVFASAEFSPPADGHPGTLFLSLTIEEGWHIYSLTQDPASAIPTKIEVDENPAYQIIGDFEEHPKPDREVPEWDPEAVYETQHGQVIYTAPIEFAPGVDPSQIAIRGSAIVGQCNVDGCLPPTSFPFIAQKGPGMELPVSEEHVELPASPGMEDVSSALPGDLPGDPSAIVQNMYDGIDEEAEAAVPVGQAQHLTATAAFTEPVDGKATLEIEVDIEEGWHIYSLTQDPNSAIPTEIAIAESPDYTVTGDFTESPAPHEVKEEWGEYETQQGRVVYTVPIEFTEGVDPSQVTIRGSLTVGQCNDDGCLPPETIGFEAKVGVAAVEALTLKSVLGTLVAAFIGGLILNIMPCVLPVIGLKIMAFFNQAGQNRMRAFLLNVSYSSGVIVLFLVLAGFGLGLGEVLSDETFTMVLLCVVFAMALSLMGLWEIRMPMFLGGSGASVLMEKEGPVGAFFKGLLTTLLAASCGAPLLSPALAWVQQQGQAGHYWLVYLVFGVVGVGMAFPYLIIGAFPELLRFLPKPGDWMETFKKIMGFLLLTAVVFLLFVLPVERAVPAVALLFAIWFACWFIGRLPLTAPKNQRATAWFWSIVVIGATFAGVFYGPFPEEMELKVTRRAGELEEMRLARVEELAEQLAASPEDKEARREYLQKTNWLPWNRDQMDLALNEGRVVIVDFTTDQCMTCKVLEHTVLRTDTMLEFVADNNVLAIQANATNQEGPEYKFFKELGGASVPLIVVFSPDQVAPIAEFHGQATTAGLIEAMQEAAGGPSSSAESEESDAG